MKYRTQWRYLKYMEKPEGYIHIPQMVLDACVGHGDGIKLLTELEGNILECLISAEQGAFEVNSLEDILKKVYWDFDQNIDYDNGTVLTIEKLKIVMDGLRKRGLLVKLDYTDM